MHFVLGMVLYRLTASCLCSPSGLMQRLVDSLEGKAHLPTILQSLGCIGQLATPVFETREPDIARYVLQNLLKLSSVSSGVHLLIVPRLIKCFVCVR